MKLKQKVILPATLIFFGAGAISTVLAVSFPAATALAQVCLDRNGQDISCEEPGAQPFPETADPDEEVPDCQPGEPGCCGGVKTSIIGGDLCGDDVNDPTAASSSVYKLLIGALKILTAGIGIAAIGGIGYGALLYTTAENKPEQVKKAIGIITNVVIGLVAYALMYVLLNFLIPGGIFT